MKIKDLPEEFRDAVDKATNLLLSRYKDTRGIVIIGSVADRTFNRYSEEIRRGKNEKEKISYFFHLKNY